MAPVYSDLISLLTAFGTNIAISAALIVGFSLLRTTNKNVYEPRLKFAEEDKRPQPLSASPVSWIKPSFFTDELELVGKIGLDAVMFLRFINVLVRLFVGTTILAIILCAVNFHAPNIDPPIFSPGSDNDGANPAFNPSLTLFSISNMVNAESQLFYIPAFFAWIISIYAYYLLYTTWLEYIKLRKAYFSSPDYLNSFYSRCVLVTDVSEHMSKEGVLEDFIKSADLSYPPSQILRGRDFTTLPQLMKAHTEATFALEAVFVKYLKDPYNLPSERPTHKIGGYLFHLIDGKKVDSIDYYGKEIRRLESEIYEMRSKGDDYYKANSSAFISFDSIKGAHSAANKLAGFIKTTMRTQMIAPPRFKVSPNFEHLIWENVGVMSAIRNTRRLIAFGMLAAITIGWTFFQAFLGTLVTIESISAYSPGIANFISRNQGLNVIVKSFVGPGLVALSNILLPMALRVVARTQGVVSGPGVEKSVLYKYFVFQVYNQLIINVVGITGVKSIWTALTAGSVSNNLIWQQVATDIVARGNVVLLYIIAGYTSYGVEIIQGAPLVIGYIKRKYFTLTPRQEYELNDEPAFDFMITYGFLTLVALIGLGYAVIAPIIVPFVTVLFLLAYVVMKYQLLYVYEVKQETGGTWWPKVFNIMCFIVGAFQLMTFGSIVVTSAVKSSTGNGKSQSMIVVVLVFITIAFYLFCSFYLAPRAAYVSKRHSAAFLPLIDHRDGSTTAVDDRGNSATTVADPESGAEHEARKSAVSDKNALANRLFNPAMVKPLVKVWVAPQSKSMLHTFYHPDYLDLVDYVRKTKVGESRDQYVTIAKNLKKRMQSFQSDRSSQRVASRNGSGDAEAGRGEGPPEDEPIVLTPSESVVEGLDRIDFQGRYTVVTPEPMSFDGYGKDVSDAYEMRALVDSKGETNTHVLQKR
ncbi:hypothetical protein BDV3_000727 [Batrachochytrium dendrobatidis]|nr:hypothetical protein QVD99_002011 [Batrachochytrium dendrobatidis]